MKFMRRTAKYTWTNYKTNEDIISELKMNHVLNKSQNYIQKWIKYVRLMDKNTLPHLIMKYQPCGKRKQGRHPPPQIYRLNEIGIGHKTYNPATIS
jgi:hypothetical protein